MRKIIFIITVLLASAGAFGQAGNDAAISNILSSMPAQNKEQLNKSMDAITALGETGITNMAGMLKAGNDNTALEYAIGGYSYYVIQPGKEAQRRIAVRAYCKALETIADNTNKQFIIKQLQQMGDDAAVSTLKKYLDDNDLGGAAARALMQINTPAANAAVKPYADAHKPVPFKPADAAGKVQTKTAALYAQVKAKGQASLPALQKAMQDGDAQYRQAALWYAAKYQTPATNKQWLALLPNISAEAQVQVIRFVAASNDAATLPAFTALLKSSNKDVRIAAIAAAGKVGNQQALPALLGVMKNGDKDEVAAAKDALLVMKGDIMPQVVNAYNTMGDNGKIAILQVIAARSYDKALPMVIEQFKSNNTDVARAAGFSLEYVAGQNDLPALFMLLNNSNADNAPVVQGAIIAAAGGITDTLQKTGIIVQAMNNAPAASKVFYLKLLAVTGGKPALALIESAWQKGDASSKPYVIDALRNSKEAGGERLLLKIARENEGMRMLAVPALVNVISNGSFPRDEKLLMLMDVMPLATNSDQRNQVLEKAGDCNTFPALVFAGKYLDSTGTEQAAAHAVLDIALSHNDYNGEIVRSLLSKAGPILNDKDADYERQAITRHLDNMPAGPGFVSMFNGKDLAGWKGLVENPIARAKMPADTLKAKQEAADKIMNSGWFVKDGYLVFSGHGDNLCTVKQYADFDMYVDWKIGPEGDAGIYLRGSPQVQIWDTSRRNVGAEVGSGGLYNNAKNQSKPLVLADNAIGEWNNFHIVMRDDKVTVYLNGVLVTDNVTLENYWDRKIPIFPKEQIELQAHGNVIYYRNLYIKELDATNPVAISVAERRDGFTALFDGTNLDQWTGDKSGYKIDSAGAILVDTTVGNPGNMYTKQEYSNFVLRFQFQLTPGANNGIGIRAPLDGDAAYVGMEIQVLDNEADMYKDLHVYQYHGSVYGVIPAKRGFLKPTGEWNEEEIVANGTKIKVTLNGEVILEGDIADASKNGTADHREHPGLKRTTGHIGFLGHGSLVRFKNVRIKEL